VTKSKPTPVPQGGGARTVMVRHLSPTVLASFKSICCRKGHSMNHALLEFIRQGKVAKPTDKASGPRKKHKRKKPGRRPPPQGRSIMIRNVPRDAFEAFKAACYARGETANETLLQFVRDFIRKDEGYVPPVHFDDLEVISQAEEG
jgi:hypothetical protein